MDNRIKYRMDPYFETICLLSSSRWDEEVNEKAIKELDAFGIDGAAFLDANMHVVKKYYAAFQKRLVQSAATKMFDSIDPIVLFIYTGIFLRHPEWRECSKEITDEAAQQAVQEAIQELVDAEGQGSSVVDTLESGDYTDQAKWQIMALLEQPKKRIEQAAHAIQENIQAFEYAYSKVKTELGVMIDQFEERSNKDQPTHLMKVSQGIGAITEVTPTLAFPFAVYVTDQLCFYGLLVDRLTGEEEPSFSKSEVLIGAKALGDSSKLEILLALKTESLYSLEIAERVNLTPATVSHHMNLLLAAGFVDIEKREGKAYYHLSKTGLERFLEGVSEFVFAAS